MESPLKNVVRYTNCLLALEDGTLQRKDLFVNNETGHIVNGQHYFYSRGAQPTYSVDLGGHILAPGFIDVQINGAYGVDFSCFSSDLEQDIGKRDEKYINDLLHVSKHIVQTGTTSFVPTIITQRKSLYRQIIPLLRPLSSNSGAHILGYHAEGPFLCPARKGAHDEPLLLEAQDGIESFEDIYGKEGLSQEGVKLITAAPDVPGVLQAAPELRKRGVTWSVGHSDATCDVAMDSVRLGARIITHLFNAMPQLHHREPGIIGLLGGVDETENDVKELETNYSKDLLTPFKRPYYGIITDGIHLHPNTVRLAYSAHPSGCIVVTDAMSMMNPDLQDGAHEWRDGKRIVKEGMRLILEGTDTLAGSGATMEACVQNLAKFSGSGLGPAILCATKHPAEMLGGEIAQKKGNLRPGSDADLVLLDRDKGTVLRTWILGREVYCRKE